MKILLVHNFYRQRGGECAVFDAERQLLQQRGHSVTTYTRHSNEIADYGPWRSATLPVRAVWAWDSHRAIQQVVADAKPDVAHFTNTFPLVSPAAYDACTTAGVAVVQSLHNYRLLCPAATLWRHGSVCEECIDHSLLRSVRYRCYQGSRANTAVLASMLALHRRRGTFTERVDCYIALTQFARQKFVSAGLSAERIAVKPNFVADPGARDGAGHHALFAGRLTPEKGLHTLLDAWKRLDAPVPLLIAGDGPLRAELEARVRSEPIGGVRFAGELGRDELLATLRDARLLVFPSRWYEGMPMVLLEAFACGVAPVASRLGAMAEMIADGETGLLFEPGDADDLAAKLSSGFSSGEAERLGRGARTEYERCYTPDDNAGQLLAIYARAVSQRRSSRRRG